MEDVRRIFIGGLYEGISTNELQNRLKSFGQVLDIDIRKKTDLDGNVVKTFAYVNLHGKEADYKKCVSLLNKSKWKGTELQLQLAKESFLTKLKREQESKTDKVETVERKKKLKQVFDKNVLSATIVPKVTKPDQRNWVRGKAGKLVPVLKLREPNSKKLIKNDPSKHQQTIKKLDSSRYDGQSTNRVENLTWKIPDDEETNVTTIISSDSEESVICLPKDQNNKNITVYSNKTTPQGIKRSQYCSSESECEILESHPNRSREFPKTKKTKVSNKQRESNSSIVDVDHQISDSSDDVTFDSKNTVTQNPRSKLADHISPVAGKLLQNVAKQNQLLKMCDSESDEPDIELWQKLVKTNSNTPITSQTQNYSESDYDSKNVHSKTKSIQKSKRRNNYPSIELKSKEQNPPILIHSIDSISSDTESVRMQSVRHKTERSKKRSVKTLKKTYSTDSDTDSSYYDSVSNTNEQNSNIQNVSFLKSCTLTDEFDTGSQKNKVTYVSGSDEDDILDIIEAGNWKQMEKIRKKSFTISEDSNIDQTINNNKSLALNKQLSKRERNEQKKNLPLINKDTQYNKQEQNICDSSSNIGNIFEKTPKIHQNKQVNNTSDSESDVPDLESMLLYKNRAKSAKNEDLSRKPSVSSSGNSPLCKQSNNRFVKKDRNVLDTTKVQNESVSAYSSDSDTSDDYYIQKKDAKEHSPKINVLHGWNVLDEHDTGFKEDLVKDFSESEDDLLDSIAAGQWSKIKRLEKQHKCKMLGVKPPIDKKKVLGVNINLQSVKDKVTGDNEKAETSNLISQAKTLSEDKSSNKNQKLSQGLKKTKDPIITSEMKHEISNVKRLETLKEKKKQADTQKTLIQKALATVDSKESSKKIVFDSDSDSSEKTSPEKKSNFSKEKHRSKPTLFDSDVSNEENGSSESDTERFSIKPQFEGKHGTKLMKLQTEFTNDERFKLDSRFVQSDSEDSDQDEEIKNVTEEKSEKQKSIEVLQSVIGRKLKVDPKDKKNKTFKDINALHYDPTREDHQQFEIKTTPGKSKENKKKKKEIEEENIKDDMPKVSDEKFFKVDSSFQDIFKDKQDDAESIKDEEEKPFSLLAMFGKAEDSEEPNKDSENISATWKPLSDNAKMSWGENYDSSDNDEHDRKDGTPAITSSLPVSCDSDKFFITIDDPSVKECMEFFCRTEPLEKLREKWQEKRPQLVESYRLKRKRSIRKNRAAQILQAKYRKKKFIQKT